MMDVVLQQGVDLVVRRAWYEHADVWSPGLYREFLLPGPNGVGRIEHAGGQCDDRAVGKRRHRCIDIV